MLKSLRVVFFGTHVDTTTSTDHTSAICYETLDFLTVLPNKERRRCVGSCGW